MILAHLPAGYLIARSWRRRAGGTDARRLAFWAMLGAVLPDIDFLWGKLVDHGAVHHHRYLTHWPLFWFAIVLTAEILRRRWHGNGHLLAVFAAGVASHLLLDWMVSDLWWAMPFSDTPSHLITIEHRYHPWVLNHLLHWSGGLDIGTAAAGVLAAITDGVQKWSGLRSPLPRASD